MQHIRQFTGRTCLWLILLWFGMVTGCGSKDNSSQRISEHPVTFASISADGRYLLNASKKNVANLIDLQKNLHLYEWHNNKDKDKIAMTAISIDGRFAATAEPHNIAVWNIADGNTMGYWTIVETITSISLGKDGHYALLGLSDGKIYYVDMHSGKSVRTFRQDAGINSVYLSHDSRYAVSGSDDNFAALWNIQTGELSHKWQHNDKVLLVAISNNNEYAFSYSQDGALNIWRIANGKLLRTLKQPKGKVTACKFAQNDKRLLIATNQRELILWNVESGEVIQEWNLAEKNISDIPLRAVAFSDKDSRILTEDAAGMLYRRKIEK